MAAPRLPPDLVSLAAELPDAADALAAAYEERVRERCVLAAALRLLRGARRGAWPPPAHAPAKPLR